MKLSRKALHIIIIIVTIVVVAIGVAYSMIKYELEGEKNMPFELSKIMVISTAEGYANEESDYKWDFNISQNNDIFISILKNDNYKKTEVIDKIVLTNFTVNEAPQKGEIVFYKPDGKSATGYTCSEDFEIKDNLEYIGTKEAELTDFQVANQGGSVAFRVSNRDIYTYQSDDGEEITHDGTLLAKANVSSDEIKCKISFDLIIELKSEKKFKGKITLELPVGNILENGREDIEITNFDDVVFKRF